MSQYAGLSLREIYAKKCEELGCKKNSQLTALLPAKPDVFEVPTSIDMSMNFVGPKGLRPLAEVVRCCTGLVSLDLRDQQMTNESVEFLCEVLLRHPSLTSLNLSDNPLTIAAGNALIELAKNNPNIETILLDNTQIRPAMFTAISAQLARNKAAKAPKVIDSVVLAADKTPAELGAMQTMDQAVVRNALASFPNSVADILFDEDPAAALATLSQKYDALFYDTQFPPETLSIQRAKSADYGVREWRRIAAFAPQAKIFPDDGPVPMPQTARPEFSWVFTCALASMSSDELRAMISPKVLNPFGVYTVRFFIDGAWRYVVVDDFLPLGADGRPVFAQPATGAHQYFWCCIVEKAVAKLHACYQALDQSVTVRHPVERRTSCAATMRDFCGGVGISRDLHHEEFNAEEWWNTMVELFANNTKLIANSMKQDSAALDVQGIDAGHAFHVRQVRQINGFKLLQLHSSYATRTYAGEWSDRSQLWEQYPQIASTLDIRNKKDKSFWIPYVKFLQAFASIHLCRTFPNFHTRMLEGEWTKATAGGPYFEQSWNCNPRFKLSLHSRGSVFLNVCVPDSRFNTSEADTLAFHVFKTGYYPIRFDKDNLVASTSYVITNSVSYDGLFAEGDYWVVPSSYVPGRTSRFFVRVFSAAAFTVRHEDPRAYWKEQTFSTFVESSGEYQNGEDNPQYLLSIPEESDPCRILVKMFTPDSEQLSVALFLCQNATPSRMLGAIPEEAIVAKSKFLINNSVMLEAYIPTSTKTNYVIVPCVNPERTATNVQLTVWCSNQRFTVKELPMWKRKRVKVDWAASGGYQDTTNNPQIELITPLPNTTFVIKVQVTGCNDPSLVFFVVANRGRVGKALRGRIPDEMVVAKSTYIRADSVVHEFTNGPHPCDSYIIVPCLQPPGSRGKCLITVSCASEDFMLHAIE